MCPELRELLTAHSPRRTLRAALRCCSEGSRRCVQSPPVLPARSPAQQLLRAPGGGELLARVKEVPARHAQLGLQLVEVPPGVADGSNYCSRAR